MIELIEKTIERFQLSEITMEFLCKFYEKEVNRDTVLLVYDNDKYYTNVAYEEILSLCCEKDLVYFLKYLCRKKDVYSGLDALKDATIIINNSSYVHYVVVKDSIKPDGKSAFFYYDLLEIESVYKDALTDMKYILHKEGVHIHFIKIPKIDEIEDEVKHPEWKLGSFAYKINWSNVRETEMKKYLSKFTDLDYDEAKRRAMCIGKTGESHGEGKRTIYLVGPCIVGGWEVFAGSALGDILYECLVNLKMNYKIVNVLIQPHPTSNIRKILEYDIKKNDIVLFIDYNINKSDIDINFDYIYNNYRGDKWLYADWPIHTTQIGNKLIVNELINKVIKPIYNTSKARFDCDTVYKGKKQLRYEEHIELERYINNFKKYNKRIDGTIGACVMTCNPFTRGHYYLIEYASKQVDLLYIFVVEEDAFFFSFEDRIEMVKRGVKEFKNVVVWPSGRFIISKETFKNYFEKEVYTDVKIDAVKDTMIFRDYISSELGISKRFIGEELGDNITNQYNQLLKSELSKVMEVIEIPRKKTRGKIISASRVRQCLQENKWDDINEMVPESTIEYLKGNIEVFKKTKVVDQSLNRIIEFIHNHSKIIVCGLGENMKDLMLKLEKILNIEDIEKLEFYDKKLSQLNYTYMGKNVIGFEELIGEYKDYYMLITTTKYKKDVFYSLVTNSVEPDHIMVINE